MPTQTEYVLLSENTHLATVLANQFKSNVSTLSLNTLLQNDPSIARLPSVILVDAETSTSLAEIISLVTKHNRQVVLVRQDPTNGNLNFTSPGKIDHQEKSLRTEVVPKLYKVSSWESENNKVSIQSSATPAARILILDDEVEICSVIANYLKIYGYESVVAHDAREALQILHQQQVDLIISDVCMPEISGPDFIEVLAHISDKVPNVLYISAFSDSDEIKNFNFQDKELIAKPFSFEAVLAKVRRALNEKTATIN